MVSAVAPRSRPAKSAAKDSQPPAKKAKLSSQPTSNPSQNGFKALLNGSTDNRSQLKAKVNGTKDARKDTVQDAAAVVRGGLGGHGDVDMDDAGDEVIEISSAVEESDYGSEDGDGEEGDTAAGRDAHMTNGLTNGDAEEEVDEDEPALDGTAEPEEMSFGERLRAQDPTAGPTVVDVEAFDHATADSNALATSSNNRALSAPNATSLGTVLTQALRTNDSDLLQSCFRVIDVDTIYATIERLPSNLVANLLSKLAELLHKKPGRAGMLMIWVQWSLAAHGAYLASQPHLVKQLATLNKVLRQRASGLQPLLALKGRLDMLQAQLELRKRNQRRAAQDEEDEAVIYVEGEDDSSSEEGDAPDDGISMRQIPQSKKGRKGNKLDVPRSEDESSDEDMPMTFEQEGESGEEDEDEDSEGMVDDEAEETEDDTGDDFSEAEGDEEMDDGEDVSESEEEERPARRSTVARSRR